MDREFPVTLANQARHGPSRVPAAAVWIPATYALASGIWIALSDLLVSGAAANPAEQAAWSIWKGLGFVAVTTLLLHLGVRAAIGRERKALERVSESEALYRAQFEEHAAVKLLVDPADGRIVDANAAAAAFYGWPRDRLRQMRVQEISTLSAEEVGLEMERTRSLVRTPFESRHRLADGSIRDVAVFSCRIPVRGKELLHSIVQDVTARRQAEEQLRQAQKMEAVGRLAGGIAHDFNNLLTVILSSSAFALEQAPPGSRLHEDVDDVRVAAERARALTAQLLAFSRRQILQPRDIDLNLVVTDAQRILKRVVGEHVAIRTVLDPRPGLVHADPGQMQQVLMNLAVNAQDAMPRGGTLTIETENDERPDGCPPGAGASVRLAVSDTGVGMDEEVRSHVFEPFFTTKPAGKGTGLGLSTVFGIVQQSRGTIRVDSTPGQGTRFEMCFPRVAPGAAPVAARTATEAAAAARPGESILVVEDDEPVRRIAVRTLEQAGFDVVSASSLPEALGRLRERNAPPHVLLTDVRMPGQSGPEVSAALSRVVPGLKTVFMSGWPDDELSADGIPAGSLFLQKPFSAQDLVARIREALGEERAVPLPT